MSQKTKLVSAYAKSSEGKASFLDGTKSTMKAEPSDIKITIPANVREKLSSAKTKLITGYITFRVLGGLSSLLLVVFSGLSIFGSMITLSISDTLICVYLMCFGLTLASLELRPNCLTVRVQQFVEKYFHFLNVIWGRGLFYIFCGSLCAVHPQNVLLFFNGIFLIVIGVVIYIVGRTTNAKLHTLHNILKNEEIVRAKFDQFDVNKNGSLEVKELSAFCAELGVDLTNNEREAALIILDSDKSGSIQFEEFMAWWKAGEVSTSPSESAIVVSTPTPNADQA